MRPSLFTTGNGYGAPRLVCNVGPSVGYGLGAKEKSLVTANRCVISHNGTAINSRTGGKIELKNSQVMNSTLNHVFASQSGEVDISKCIFFLAGRNAVLSIDGGLVDITDASFFGWGKNGWITNQSEFSGILSNLTSYLAETPTMLNYNWCMVAYHGTLKTTRCILDSTSYWGLEASVGSIPGNACAYYTLAGAADG